MRREVAGRFRQEFGRQACFQRAKHSLDKNVRLRALGIKENRGHRFFLRKPQNHFRRLLDLIPYKARGFGGKAEGVRHAQTANGAFGRERREFQKTQGRPCRFRFFLFRFLHVEKNLSIEPCVFAKGKSFQKGSEAGGQLRGLGCCEKSGFGKDREEGGFAWLGGNLLFNQPKAPVFVFL